MQRVAIVSGCRTPFVRAAGAFSKYSALDLGMHIVPALVKRSGVDPATIDELAFGSVLLDTRTPNLAREIVLRSGLPKSLNAHFVSNNCISGLVAATFISDAIRVGRIRVGIAGGVESMSRPALSVNPKAEALFIKLSRARSLSERLKIALGYRLKYAFPVPPSPKEPSTGLTMGQHCEITTQERQISRQLQDEIALKSHQNAAQAQSNGYLESEIEPLGDVKTDNLIRKDTTLEKLASLKPVFDRTSKGTLTAGNSSSLTDGASAVMLMSEEEAKRQDKEILGYISASQFASVAPADGLLMAPGIALPKLLSQANLNVSDIDFFEIHEAFAAQVAANIEVWEKGWPRYPQMKPIGVIPREKINVNGGSIAIGHPFAATGGRLILAAANQLKRSGKKRCVISVCAAGAMACAMLIERA